MTLLNFSNKAKTALQLGVATELASVKQEQDQ